MKQALYLLFLIPLCSGVIQEITFHESATNLFNNSYIYRQSVPDVSLYPFQKVVRFCTNTTFPYFSTANYETYVRSYDSNCYSSVGNLRSFRIAGNRDTMVDGISAYSGLSWTGDETYVDHSPFVIHTPIKSLGYTGRSAWTVFQNDNFAGRSACLPAASGTAPTFISSLSALGITTIGSLFKGCGVVTPEISEAMRQQVRARG